MCYISDTVDKNAEMKLCFFTLLLGLLIMESEGSVTDAHILTSPVTEFHFETFQNSANANPTKYDVYELYGYYLLKQFLFLWYLWQVCIMWIVWKWDKIPTTELIMNIEDIKIMKMIDSYRSELSWDTKRCWQRIWDRVLI